MNRRLFLAFPGLGALLASRAMSQEQEPAVSSAPGVVRPSRKALTKHSGSKGAYKIPKSAAKQAKYVASLSALLALTSSQQQQAAAILANAAGSHKTAHKGLQTARKALRDAVMANDTGAITQASNTISALTGQRIANGALAHAALLQVLTPDQQARLSQFQG